MNEYELSENPLDHTEEWDGERIDREARAIAFRAELKRLDSRLDIFRAKPNATVVEGGFYYIVRHNDIGIPAYWQVHDGHGNPCEPDSRHLDMMKRNDLTNTNVREELEAARRRADAEKQKARARRSEEFQGKLLERLNHLYDTQISVPKAIDA